MQKTSVDFIWNRLRIEAHRTRTFRSWSSFKSIPIPHNGQCIDGSALPNVSNVSISIELDDMYLVVKSQVILDALNTKFIRHFGKELNSAIPLALKCVVRRTFELALCFH
jgi:hypothetical protein